MKKLIWLLSIAAVIPSIAKKIRKVSPYNHNFNYYTFNYTMAWWDNQYLEKLINL